MTIDELKALQRARADHEASLGQPMFMGLPERWFERPRWRCTAGHVSAFYIKSEEQGDLCPACRGRVVLTWPEDHEEQARSPIVVSCGRCGFTFDACRCPRERVVVVPERKR